MEVTRQFLQSIEAQEDLLNAMNKLSHVETELQHARAKLEEIETECPEVRSIFFSTGKRAV